MTLLAGICIFVSGWIFGAVTMFIVRRDRTARDHYALTEGIIRKHGRNGDWQHPRPAPPPPFLPRRP